ncbi:MAG: glycerol-3-phosphate acyltransferase [Candidatus Nealsonbacteria bacterium]
MNIALSLGYIFIFISYFIGSWPVGRSMAKFFNDVEVENTGSGKGGTTNVIRTTGDRMLGAVVFLIDAGIKGTFWIFAMQIIFGMVFHTYAWILYACFAAVLLGHIFPALTKFKTGGAGIAILIGGLMSLVPGLAYALGIAAWLVMFHLSHGVKFLCNIAAVSTLLLTGLLFDFSWPFLGFVVFAIGLTSLAHRQNFARWRRGKESKNSWADLWKSILKLGEMFKKNKP